MSVEHSKILHQARDVQDEYDYIIVGGGTSGLTVADRLTESGERTFWQSREGKADIMADVDSV